MDPQISAPGAIPPGHPAPIGNATPPATPLLRSLSAVSNENAQTARSAHPPAARVQAQPRHISRERPGPPDWPRTYLEMKENGECQMASPGGEIQVVFTDANTTSSATEPMAASASETNDVRAIRIAFSGREKTISFADGRRLARGGRGVPTRWQDALIKNDCIYQAQYEIAAFHPLILSPDEKTVFCILEKEGSAPILQEIREDHSKEIDMPRGFEREIPHISGMACNAAGAIFIYCNKNAKEESETLHILEDGRWRSLDVTETDPRPTRHEVRSGDFFISALAPNGSSLVLAPHNACHHPRLIALKDPDHQDSGQVEGREKNLKWWQLLQAGDTDDRTPPCLVAYSPDSRFLAMTTHKICDIIMGSAGAVIFQLEASLKKPTGSLLIPERRDFINMAEPLWFDSAHLPHLNDIRFSFSKCRRFLTKAVFQKEQNRILEYKRQVFSVRRQTATKQ